MGDQSAVEMKRCGRCKEWYPLDKFKIEPSTQRPYCYCIYCQSKSVFLKYTSRMDDQIPGTELTVGEILKNPRREPDTTFRKVVKALYIWVKEKTLTMKQAETLLLHVVDGLSFSDIGRMYDMTPRNIKFHYDAGIRNLRRRYGIEQEVAG